jgi:hypothetical protein
VYAFQRSFAFGIRKAARTLTVVLGLCSAAFPLLAQLPTIHDYADAAACQMGGREANYLPSGILPGGARIPITWNQMEIFWVPANNPPDGTGEFKVMTPTGLQSMAADVPEKGAGGPFMDPTQSGLGNPTGTNLRCDHFSYVDPSCTPDQFVREVFQGSCAAGANQGAICSADTQCPGSTCGGLVRWHILFRRTAASAKAIDNNPATPKPADWGPIYTPYYDIVDAIGLKIGDTTNQAGSYATVWLDGVGAGSCGGGVNAGMNCALPADCPGSMCVANSAARDFANGFRAGPMPRPGGKRPAMRAEGMRATTWFDLPATMKNGNCSGCHGTPFNGSDWIAQTSIEFQDDEAKPWWHAGNEKVGFTEKAFFSAATQGGVDFRCNGCHRQWMVGAGSTPGGETFGDGFSFARYMTMVHDAHMKLPINDSKGQPDIDNPFGALAAGSGGANAYRSLASLWRTDRPDPDPAKDKPFLDKNAQQTHWMPKDHNFTSVRAWLGSCVAGANAGNSCSSDADCPGSTCRGVRNAYNWVACCGAATLAGTPPAIMVGPGQPVNTGDGPAFACGAVTCKNPIAQSQVKALFLTPWMRANGMNPVAPAMAQPNGTQFIDAPDSPTGVSLTLVDCPAALPPANPGDRCFRLAWSDPSGSPFNAPQTFHYSQLPRMAVNAADWTDAQKQSTQYCGDGLPSQLTVGATNVFPSVTETQIPVASGDKWRFSYESIGSIKKCEKMAIRLCGGWCLQAIKLAGEPDPAAPNRMSTEIGQLLTLANDTQGDVSNSLSILRSGFRKNLTTGRYVQTITLTNMTQAAIPSPLSLVLMNLSGNATLFNASGATGNPASPYLSVAAGGDTLQLGAGASVTVTLEFTNPSNQGITYTTQILALSVSADCK